jgi:hypothetical protein
MIKKLLSNSIWPESKYRPTKCLVLKQQVVAKRYNSNQYLISACIQHSVNQHDIALGKVIAFLIMRIQSQT